MLRQRQRLPDRLYQLGKASEQRPRLPPQRQHPTQESQSLPSLKKGTPHQQPRLERQLLPRRHRALRQSMTTPAGSTSTSAPQQVSASGPGSMPAPPAKPKPASETGKAPSTSGAPSGAASQSSVTASAGYPTIAESLGQKRSPPLKAAPSSKSTTTPLSQTEKIPTAAAKGPPPASPQGKAGDESKSPATSTDPKVQEESEPKRAQRAPAAPVAIEKDAAI